MSDDLAYMHMLSEVAPTALEKFLQATALAGHREAVPSEAGLVAGLVGVMAEDCGPCVQILVNMAREGGVDDEVVEGVLTSDTSKMTDDTRLAFHFASAIAVRSSGADEIREAVRQRWGDKGVIDLTMATQANRLYPMVKMGLGFARTCQTVRVGEKSIVPAIPRTQLDDAS